METKLFFNIDKKIKNTESAQLWPQHCAYQSCPRLQKSHAVHGLQFQNFPCTCLLINKYFTCTPGHKLVVQAEVLV